jgi:hypothetical protein
MRRLPALVAACALAVAAGSTAAQAAQPDVNAARQATARFHDLSKATDAGYGLFTDAKGIACIDQPGAGGMGIHYVNGALVGDDQVDLHTPEALVYDPGDDGRLRLVAAEYIVFQAAWDAHHSAPPRLFGQEFELTPAGNRFGIPAFYELHAWLWKPNARGFFDDWNPRVVC